CFDRAETHFALQHKTPDNVRFGSKADMCSALGDVRFTPESRHSAKAVSAYPWLTAPPFMH
ncbi:MAG: hypothetical protein WCC77_26190, partial [Pseudolabrys sp.]